MNASLLTRLSLVAVVAVGVFSIAATLPPPQSSTVADTIVLETDAEGEAVVGSVAELIEHVRAGAEIRVGWELSFRTSADSDPLVLEHWCDAGFLTVWQGHVFAQIHDIYTQGPMIDQAGVHLGREPHGWVAMLGSNGTMRQAFADGEPQVSKLVTRWAVVR